MARKKPHVAQAYDRNGKVIGVTVSDSPSLPPLGGWVTSGPLVRDPGGFLREVVEEGMVEAGPVKKKAKTKAAVRRSSRFVVDDSDSSSEYQPDDPKPSAPHVRTPVKRTAKRDVTPASASSSLLSSPPTTLKTPAAFDSPLSAALQSLHPAPSLSLPQPVSSQPAPPPTSSRPVPPPAASPLPGCPVVTQINNILFGVADRLTSQSGVSNRGIAHKIDKDREDTPQAPMHDPAVSGSKNRSDGSKLGASTFEGKKASAAPVAQDPPTADGTNDDEDTIEVAQLSRASLRDREMRTSMGLPPLSYVSKTDNKRLAIDGRPALLAPSNDDMIQVYDYGGKTYAVKGDEKKEWLKNVRMIPRSTSRHVTRPTLGAAYERSPGRGKFIQRR